MMNAEWGWNGLAFAKKRFLSLQSAVDSLFSTSDSPPRRSLGEGVALSKMPFSRGERKGSQCFAEILYALCTMPNAIKSRYSAAKKNEITQLRRFP